MARRTTTPPWQKAVILLSGSVCAVLSVAVLSWGRAILMPMAVAVFLAFILSPVVRFLVRRRVPHAPAVVATTTLAVLVTLGVAWVLTQQLTSLTMSLPDHKDRILTKVRAMKAWVSGGDSSRLGDLVTEIESTVNPKKPKEPKEAGSAVPTTVPEPVSVESTSTGWSGWADRFISPAAEGLGQFAFAGVLVIFLLLKKEDLRDRLIRLVGDGQVTTTTKALDDASERVSRFLLKQFVFNLLFGVVVTVGLFFLNVQYAILWGALAAVMRYLPYVGTWIGVIPPTVYTLAVTDAWWPPVAVLVFILGLELICNNLIEPFLYGQSLGVSEVAQLVAAGFWSFMWGPIGLILSGPLTTCLLVLGKYVPGLKFLDVILGNEPSLSRGVMFFQRLTAKDDDAASRLFDESVATDGATVAVDVVALPALQLIKTADRDGDLTPDAVTKILVSVREITDDLPRNDSPMMAPEPLPKLLIIPARDEIDAVACELLTRLLPIDKWDVTVAASATLTGEIVDLIGSLDPDLVVVGSVRPGGISHSRYITKKIRAKHADVPLIVGRWGTDEADVEPEPESTEKLVGYKTTAALGETAVVVMGWRPSVAAAALNDAMPQPVKPLDTTPTLAPAI